MVNNIILCRYTYIIAFLNFLISFGAIQGDVYKSRFKLKNAYLIYLQLLQKNIVPLIRGLPNVDMNTVFSRLAGGQEIFETNPDRTISSTGTIKWPLRSPDLASLDFHLKIN